MQIYECFWKVIGVSVQGTSHIKTRTICQDSHEYLILPNEDLLIVVADGAGSAVRSDEGSSIATTSVKRLFAELPKGKQKTSSHVIEPLIRDAYRIAQQNINKYAENNCISPSDFATTLAVAYISDGWFIVGQIGDGAVVAKKCDGSLFSATTPQHGEYANETFFLTEENALERLEVCTYFDEISAIIAMTDGLIRLAITVSTNEPLPGFFRGLTSFTSLAYGEDSNNDELINFLESEKICSRTSDDKTLVIAVKVTSLDPDPSDIIHFV